MARPPGVSSSAAAVAGALLCLVVGGVAGCGAGLSADRDGEIRDQIRAWLQDEADAETARAREEHGRRMEEAVTRCMRAHGFDFQTTAPHTPPEPKLGLDDEDYVHQYGWGISTLIDYVAPGQRLVNANAVFRAALPPSAQDQYDVQLRTCWAQAQEDAGPPPGAALDPDASDIFTDLELRAEADPRVVEARAGYAACMSRQGFPVASSDELRQSVNEQVDPFRQRFEYHRNEVMRSGRDATDLRMADVLDGAEMARLADIQQFEIHAAVADFECGTDLYPLRSQVRDEYLSDFLGQ